MASAPCHKQDSAASSYSAYAEASCRAPWHMAPRCLRRGEESGGGAARRSGPPPQRRDIGFNRPARDIDICNAMPGTCTIKVRAAQPAACYAGASSAMSTKIVLPFHPTSAALWRALLSRAQDKRQPPRAALRHQRASSNFTRRYRQRYPLTPVSPQFCFILILLFQELFIFYLFDTC